MNPLDRRAWQPWDAAWEAVNAGRADGVGLAITPGIRLTAIDLDDCVDGQGSVGGEAKRIVEMFPGAYVEYSPSGNGVHLLVRAPCPPGWRRQSGIELIDSGFITVTEQGYGLNEPSLPDHTDALAAWHSTAVLSRTPPLAPAWQMIPRSRPDWFIQACRARNGARFLDLWQGRLAGCASPSEADLHLLLIILYWNPDLTDDKLLMLWKQSGRLRRKLADEYYVLQTIKAARQRNRW